MKIRIATPEMMALRVPPADVPRALLELAQHVTWDAIAEVCDCDPSTVRGWLKREPKHQHGATVLALHRKFCGER